MIQANELRIGNFIQRIGFPLEVVGIKNNDVFIKAKNVEIEYYIFDGIQPIPLTEEWLIRLGFEKSNRIDSGERKPCYCIFSLDLMIRHNSFFIDWIGGNTEIKYVHQLQNLYFALTGEELELTNSNKSS